MGLCRTCGTKMTYVEPGLDPHHHPTCGPNLHAPPNPIFFDEPAERDPFHDNLQRDLTEVIEWGYRQAPRSQQVMVGPSELGGECDRKLAFRLAGVAPLNHRIDPWPAIVGTAVHGWLEEVMHQFQTAAGAARWLIETEVKIDNMVIGHVDLYDIHTRTVLDWKTIGSSRLKKYREEGPLADYRTQVHLYGLGMIRAGYPVDQVGLVGLPRSGWLSGMWVWSEPYDESIAQAALKRMYQLGEQLLELDADHRPEQIRAVEATPSRMCSFCEFYTPESESDIGCPGK